MDQAGVGGALSDMRIRRLPGTPFQSAWNARVEDWRESSEKLLKLDKEHAEGYRRRVCSRCTPEQRVQRECSSLTAGYEELECDHMKRAFVRKYGWLIDQNVELHPLFVRMRLNAELESRNIASHDFP